MAAHAGCGAATGRRRTCRRRRRAESSGLVTAKLALLLSSLSACFVEEWKNGRMEECIEYMCLMWANVPFHACARTPVNPHSQCQTSRKKERKERKKEEGKKKKKKATATTVARGRQPAAATVMAGAQRAGVQGRVGLHGAPPDPRPGASKRTTQRENIINLSLIQTCHEERDEGDDKATKRRENEHGGRVCCGYCA